MIFTISSPGKTLGGLFLDFLKHILTVYNNRQDFSSVFIGKTKMKLWRLPDNNKCAVRNPPKMLRVFRGTPGRFAADIIRRNKPKRRAERGKEILSAKNEEMKSAQWGEYKGDMDGANHMQMVGAYYGGRKCKKAVIAFYVNLIKQLGQNGY